MIEQNRFPGLFSEHVSTFRALIENIGCVISGDFEKPILDVDAIGIRDGMIDFMCKDEQFEEGDFDFVVDAQNTTVFPGLIDSHVHPTMGQYSPRTDQSFWISHCLHGGVTSMISAGEVHAPGRPVDPAGVKALAIATHKCFSNYRPGGVKLMAGAPLLELGLTRDDFAEMAKHGVKLIGEVGIGGVSDVKQAAQMVGWAREFGMKSLTHTGGPSIPSSRLVHAEEILEIDPDVIGHINGGHTALPRDQIQCLCENCSRSLEIVHNGNEFAAVYALNLAKEMGQLERIILGTDAPSGAGVPALGMIRLIAMLSSLGDVPAEQVFCFATGNTARIRELNCGFLEVGKPADIVIADKPKGGEGETLLQSVQLGNLPGIGMVLSDGKPCIFPSQNTPPAETLPKVNRIEARFYPNLFVT